MVVKIKKILLTFDVEEFDLPLEFGIDISENEQFEISRRGLENITDSLDNNKIRATFFLSAKFAKQYPELIKKISMKHEIGIHCLEHGDNYQKMNENEAIGKIKKGKEIIEKIINKKIIGFRAPRFQPPAYSILNKIGIKYDSSLHPTYIPGRYNNFFSPRNIFSKDNVKIIPATVSPILRLPIFWLAFRNLPLIYSKYITNRSKNYVCLTFHPWEFVDIKNMNLPKLIKRNTGDKLIKKVDSYLSWCLKKEFKFETVENYLLTS